MGVAAILYESGDDLTKRPVRHSCETFFISMRTAKIIRSMEERKSTVIGCEDEPDSLEQSGKYQQLGDAKNEASLLRQ